MLLWENMKLALTAIRVNKMRSFLTMLGMIIGISSVIAIVSIGDTMREMFVKEYEGAGLNRIVCYVMKIDGYYYYSEMITTDQFEQIETVFADVGGVYNGEWIQAVSRWVTNIYGKSTTLPRTGY